MSDKEYPFSVRLFGAGVLVLLGVLLGAVASEAGLRTYLYVTGDFRRVAGIRTTWGAANGQVYNEKHWIFDKRYGYRYPSAPVAPNITTVRGSKIHRCAKLDYFNERGNIGTPIRTRYGNAAVRIAMFGSSFLLDPIRLENGSWQTWPMVLERILTERLGKPVAVVNFGRDGYGVTQMIDLAAGMIPEWKPDLAIISFISGDLDRIRLWRTATKVNGIWRYLVSPYPDPHPDPSTAYDTAIFNPSATHEWCVEMKRKFRPEDPVFKEIRQTFEAASRRVKGSWKSPVYFAWRLDHSYLYQRLTRRDPFFGIYPAWFEGIKISDFANDPRIAGEAEALRKAGTKIALFHMARDGELAKGVEFIASAKQRSLADSLSKLFGTPLRHTTDNVQMPVENPGRLRRNERNGHPSLEGQEFYAAAVADMLFKEGYLPLD